MSTGVRYLQRRAPRISISCSRTFALKSSTWQRKAEQCGLPRKGRRIPARGLPPQASRRAADDRNSRARRRRRAVGVVRPRPPDDYRFLVHVQHYTPGENGRHSQCLVLLAHMVRESAKRGLRSFDLGVGRAEYKSYFCREPQPCSIASCALGARAALRPVFGTTFAARRVIKQKPDPVVGGADRAAGTRAG